MPLFDTHTHLNAQQFAGQEADYIARALAADVGYLAVVGFDDPTIERSLALSAAYDNIISVVGWHPTEAHTYTDQVERRL